MIKPNKLNIGDTIGVISPCYLLHENDISGAVSEINRQGFKVKYSENIFKNTYGFGASREERAEDFNKMISDKEIKMILFGGGENCNEILPFIDYDSIKKNPKIICSYSDSTTILNAIKSKSELVTFYGINIGSFDNINDYNLNSFKNRFLDPNCRKFEKDSEWKFLYKGKREVAGEIIGGYLVNFALMLNNEYLKIDKNKEYILIIEDNLSFSQPIVVSKYLNHIEQSGLLKNVSGLLFGHYSEEKHPEIDEILTRIGQYNEISVIRCEDFGHGSKNGIIPLGIKGKIDFINKNLIFSENCII